MGKTLTEAPVTTRNARAKLPAGVHWRGIDPDVHLGYRRSARGGSWLVRWRDGTGYKQRPIGTADDVLDGDGIATFTFAQAIAVGRRLVEEHRSAAALTAAGPLLTVAGAVDEYLGEREARERAAKPGGKGVQLTGRSRMRRHVLSNDGLASSPVALLTEARIIEWRDSLPGELSPASRQRLASDFRAALNRAARVHRGSLPPHLPVVIRNGFASREDTSPRAREAQVLPDADVRRIVSAALHVDAEGEWEGDLHRLVMVMAATGARFSQVVRMTVGDVQAANGRLMVPVSRKGRGSKAANRIAVRVGDDVIAAVRPALAGRRGSDTLLLRPRWKQLTPTVWTKLDRAPWWSSSELTRVWRKITTVAELPADVVPYALRHSSIVRGLRAGLPVRLVAALHDTSSAMIERHYSAYVIDAMDDLAAKAIVPLTSGTVIGLDEVRGHAS